MRVIPLAPVPNQSFVVTIDDVRWRLAIKEAVGVMVCDVERSGIAVVTGSRVLSGEMLIPYAYLQTGNFIVVTLDGDLPAWRDFGVSQFLVYLDASELAAVPSVTAGEISAAQERVGFLYTDQGFYITTDTGELITDA